MRFPHRCGERRTAGNRIPGAVVLALLAGGGSAPARASIGTGVGAAAIVLAQPARPGHSYPLPDLYVVNTGSERTRYYARVQRVSPVSSARRRVPTSWVRFARQTVTLDPGQTVNIRLTLALPRGAPAGLYASDVLVTSLPSGKGFTRVGTGAATALRFTVAAARRR